MCQLKTRKRKPTPLPSRAGPLRNMCVDSLLCFGWQCCDQEARDAASAHGALPRRRVRRRHRHSRDPHRPCESVCLSLCFAHCCVSLACGLICLPFSLPGCCRSKRTTATTTSTPRSQSLAGLQNELAVSRLPLCNFSMLVAVLMNWQLPAVRWRGLFGRHGAFQESVVRGAQSNAIMFVVASADCHLRSLLNVSCCVLTCLVLYSGDRTLAAATRGDRASDRAQGGLSLRCVRQFPRSIEPALLTC